MRPDSMSRQEKCAPGSKNPEGFLEDRQWAVDVFELLGGHHDITASITEGRRLSRAQRIWTAMAGGQIEPDISTRKQWPVRHRTTSEVDGDRGSCCARLGLKLLGQQGEVYVAMMTEARTKTRTIEVVRGDPWRCGAGRSVSLAAPIHVFTV